MRRWSRKTDCYVPWPARSSWPSCHPRVFRGSGRLHPMDLPSEPPSPHNVPSEGGCRWLPGPGPAAGLLLLCSFNARTQPQHPGMGVEGSLLACPFPPGLPRVPRPFGKRENPGLGACLELLIHGRTQHHLLPWVSVFWGPSPAPPAIDGLERFGGSLAGPTPTPPCPLQAPPLLCPGEGVWTVSSTSGIQVVIKIIIIIKKSEET